VLRGIAIVALCFAAAGCGGGKHASTATTAATAPAGSCVNAKAMAKLNADVAAIKHASRLPTTNRLLGNAPINRATDRFLYDLAVAKIDFKRKNRLIDLAAGSLANQCEQCFQAFEAARPIPGLRYGETGCGA
jgi:hypothetical protein